MPAVKISARLKLDENIEGTNWCPSISGWTPVSNCHAHGIFLHSRYFLHRLGCSVHDRLYAAKQNLCKKIQRHIANSGFNSLGWVEY
jgi:hypothetical protein